MEPVVHASPAFATPTRRARVRLLLPPALAYVVAPLAALLLMTVGQALRGSPPGHPNQHYAIDFREGFWQGGRDVWNGRNPYLSPAALAAKPAHDVGNFVNPAPVAVAFAPLGALPYPVAAALDSLLLIAALLLALKLLDVRDWRCYGAAFLSPAILTSISVGTLTPLLVLLLAAFWRYRDRPAASGLCLALLLIGKPFFWPLLGWLLVTRRVRAAVLSAVFTAALCLAGWAVIGFDGFTSYPSLLQTFTRVTYAISYSPAALVHAVGTGRAVAIAVTVVAAVVLLAGSAVAVRSEAVLFVAALAASFLATPVVWLHYLAILVVPIALAAPYLNALWFVPLALWATAQQHAEGSVWRLATVLAVLAAVLAVSSVRVRPAVR
jgi:hypothetical protein